jgi:hypothetical protein
MKKENRKRVTLNRETIRHLVASEMGRAVGGVTVNPTVCHTQSACGTLCTVCVSCVRTCQ